MKHRNNHFAVGYWSRIREGRAAPDQADIDPKALKRLLPYVFVLDTHAGFEVVADAQYRLAGTALCERFGGELRGKSFFAHWDENSRLALGVLLQRSLQRCAPVCLTSIGASDDGRMVELETVLMPITFGGREPKRFLGMMQIMGDIAPLMGRTIAYERLTGSLMVQEHETAATTPPSGGLPAEASRPRLRLVVSHDADPLKCETMEKILTAPRKGGSFGFAS
jgi:hypothetical protein